MSRTRRERAAAKRTVARYFRWERAYTQTYGPIPSSGDIFRASEARLFEKARARKAAWAQVWAAFTVPNPVSINQGVRWTAGEPLTARAVLEKLRDTPPQPEILYVHPDHIHHFTDPRFAGQETQ